ncbi:glycosyltransferase [Patescibacteria group bacterium]|nr:glycosyltransferase [Patescibacteria group bacterium]
MRIVVLGFDWKDLAHREPEALLHKLRRDHIDPALHEVVLYQFAPSAGDFFVGSEGSVRVLRRRARWEKCRPLYDLLAAIFLPKDLASIGFIPDVVVVHDFPFVWAAKKLKEKYGTKILLYVSNLPTNLSRTRRGSWLKGLYHSLFERYAKRVVDSVCAINETTAAYAQSIGIEKSKIHIATPDIWGVPLNVQELRNEKFLRRACNLKEDTEIVLSVGRLEPEKGFERLIRAFAALKRKDSVLVIVGTGRLSQKLQKLARELEIEQKVYFVGHVSREDIWKAYADADVFVLLSRSEALGLVALEAMRLRLPVVVSGVGGLGESVGTHGERGYIWNEEDGIERLDSILSNVPKNMEVLERAEKYVTERIETAKTSFEDLLQTKPKLLYATSNTYPSPLANRIQTLAMAREFARVLGEQFVYGVRTFNGAKPEIRSKEFVKKQNSILLGLQYYRYIKAEHFSYVICREPRLLFWIMLYAKLFALNTKFFFEAHTVSNDFFFKTCIRKVDGVIAITQGIVEDLHKTKRVVVAADGVDLKKFENLRSREEIRDKYELPQSAKLVMYAGSFGFIPPWDYFAWKGADILLEAAPQLADTAELVFVGGEPEEILQVRKRYPQKNIYLLGRVPNEDVPALLSCADILVLPNKSGDTMSERYTSPLKLFEYMASGVPIVASNLPSIREILSEEEAYLVEPNSAEAVAIAVRKALEHRTESVSKAQHAQKLVKDYTWEQRARNILSFMMST